MLYKIYSLVNYLTLKKLNKYLKKVSEKISL